MPLTSVSIRSVSRKPFGLRVFSTMNSPGSLGAILSAGIILGLKRSLPVSTVTVCLMLAGLALCQYRSIWGATALGVLTVAFSRRGGLKVPNVLALVVIAAVALSSTGVPRIREVLFARASSLASLHDDDSLRERLAQYSSLGNQEDLIAGQGLAIVGAARRVNNEAPVVMDGALIEIWSAMGVLVGTLFMATLAVLLVSLFRKRAPDEGHFCFDRAIVISTFVLMPMGSVHTGEMGFCAWLFLGFALASRLKAPAALPGGAAVPTGVLT